MPASSSVSHREPARTNSEAATTGVALFSRTSTVRPLGSCSRRGPWASATPARAHAAVAASTAVETTRDALTGSGPAGRR